jgi:hypothetical protein
MFTRDGLLSTTTVSNLLWFSTLVADYPSR